MHVVGVCAHAMACLCRRQYAGVRSPHHMVLEAELRRLDLRSKAFYLLDCLADSVWVFITILPHVFCV